MKRLAVVLLMLLFFTSVSLGQSWTPVNTNQITAKWDAVTILTDGTPIPAEDVISYKVWKKKLPGGAQELVGETSELQYTITFTGEGEYAVGVMTVRTLTGGTVVESDINWSIEDGIYTPNPFSVKYYVQPSCVKDLRY